MASKSGSVKFFNLVLFSVLLTVGFISWSMVQTKKERALENEATVDAGDIKHAVQSVDDPDVIARVGDETISYSELSTMLNSSAMVGLSVPALGTRERSHVIITLLDKAISANLLYLDAKQKGTDRLPSYANDVRRFEDAILGSLYKEKVMIGDIPVSDEEINAYYNSSVDQDVAMDEDVKLAIESMVRKQKLSQLKSTLRERLREGLNIEINHAALDPQNDAERAESEIVANINGEMVVVWSDVRDLMRGADRRVDNAAFYLDNEEERLQRLDNVIDSRILAYRAREAGFENDETYIKRTEEYRKTRLVNLHRSGLIHSWNPSDDELKDYFVEHMDEISIPEMRKLQMVVVASEDEANKIKQRIDDGKITMYQAAQKYSLDPNAKSTLGEMGWVSQGTGFAGLDDFTFNLEPEVVGGPVQSPAGWHLVKVLDVRDGQLQIFEEPRTQQVTLRHYMKQKLDRYVVELRKGTFEVAVFDAQLQKHFQDEADWIAELNRKAAEEGSVTSQRVNDMQKWIGEHEPVTQ